MILTLGIAQRLLKVRCAPYQGTAFTIEYEERQYVVTAAHVVIERAAAPFQCWRNGGWVDLAVTGWWVPSDAQIDVAVGALRYPASQPLYCPLTGTGISVGQDVSFAGFPHGMSGDEHDLLAGRPTGVVRRGILAALKRERFQLWIDAGACVGFSGAPILWSPAFPISKNDAHVDVRIAGILAEEHRMPSPLRAGDKESALTLDIPLGIARAFDIVHAVTGAAALGNGAHVGPKPTEFERLAYEPKHRHDSSDVRPLRST